MRNRLRYYLLAAVSIAAISSAWLYQHRAGAPVQAQAAYVNAADRAKAAQKLLANLHKAELAHIEAARKKEDLATRIASLLQSSSVPVRTQSPGDEGSTGSGRGPGSAGPSVGAPIWGGMINPWWVPTPLPPQPIFTVTPSASVYKLGDPVVLTLTLQYAPDATEDYSPYETICTFAPGTVSVRSVKHSLCARLPKARGPSGTVGPDDIRCTDGIPVTPTLTIADFPDGMINLQLMSLANLQRGGSVNIPFPLGVDANGASLLYDTIAAFGAYSVVKVNQETGQQEVTDVPDHATNVYAFNQPGLYTVQLRYKFTGLASLNSLTFQLTGLPYWKGWPVYNPYFDTIDSNEATFRIQ